MKSVIIPAFLIVSLLLFLRVLLSRYFWRSLYYLARHPYLLVPFLLSLLIFSRMGWYGFNVLGVEWRHWLRFLPEGVGEVIFQVWMGIFLLSIFLVVLALQLAYLRDLFTGGRVRLLQGPVNAVSFPIPAFLGLLVSYLIMAAGLFIPLLLNRRFLVQDLPFWVQPVFFGVLLFLSNLIFAGFYPSLILEGKRFWGALGSSISFGFRKFFTLAPFVLAYLVFMGVYSPVASKGGLPQILKDPFVREAREYRGLDLRSASVLHFWDNRVFHAMAWNDPSLEGMAEFSSPYWISAREGDWNGGAHLEDFSPSFSLRDPLHLLCAAMTLLFTMIFCQMYVEMLAQRMKKHNAMPEEPWPGYSEPGA